MILIERMNFKKLLMAIALKVAIAVVVLIYSKKMVAVKVECEETLSSINIEIQVNKSIMINC